MAAIIIGVIVLVGYKAIDYFIGLGREAKIKTAFTDFASQVEITSKKYGSQVTYTFSDIPPEYTAICFVDSRNEEGVYSDAAKTSSAIYDYPLIRTNVQNDIKENVYLMSQKNIEYEVEVPKLDIPNSDDFICIDNDKKIEVILKGTGRKTSLIVP